MHEFSTAKVPAYTAAESSYLEALDTLSNDVQTTRLRNSKVQQKRKRDCFVDKPPRHSDNLIRRGSEEESWVPSESDQDDSMGSYDIPEQLQTPTRTGRHHSATDNLRLTPVSSPKSTTSPTEEDSRSWDFRATAKSGLIKTSSGTLLEARPNLPRSASTMHLIDAPSSFQPISWEEDDDDPFKDYSKKSFSFSTPKLSPIAARSEDSGSPTPRGRTPKTPRDLTSSPQFSGGDTDGFFSSPAARDSLAEARYTAHEEALQLQLRTHLDEVHRLKTETVTVQAERARERARKAMSMPTKLPQSRSFWSFKDPQTETTERTARIEKGRARGWTRERFDPKKYSKLADEAMAELRGGI